MGMNDGLDEMVDATGIAANYTLMPEDLEAVLEQYVERNRPLMIWGPPGVGKSAMMRTLAARLDRIYVDYRALQRDPVDISGVPTVVDGRTVWATPGFLPPQDSKNKFLINLEELSAATPAVQASLYQLVLDRQVGDSYTLPDGAAIVACGNRTSDRGVSYKMPKPLANRFRHADLETDYLQWCDWALTHKLAPEVVFFIRFNPDMLFNFNPRSEENAFPTPRTWEMVSQDLGIFDRRLERIMIRGTVGEGAAAAFCAYMDVFRELDDPQTILDNPQTARVPKDKSALIATCTGLAKLVAQKDNSEDYMDSVTIYGARNGVGREIGEFLVSTTVKMNPEAQYTEAYIEWCKATA